MAENHRSPGHDVVDEGATVHVFDSRAMGLLNEERLAANRTEGADRGVDTTG